MLTTFLKRDEGNVAMIFTLAMVPIVGLLGMSIDYSRGVQAKAKMAAGLDAAALAAAAQSQSVRATFGPNFLNSYLAGSNIVLDSQSFVTNADGTVTATASGSIPTYVAGILGKSSMAFNTSVTVAGVAQPPIQLIFTAVSAQGWYWKQVDLIVQNANASTESTLASYVYQPTSQTNSSGTLKATYNDGAGNMVAGALNKQISLSKNYKNLYLKMTVYSDGCGPGMVPAHDSTSSAFKCAQAGSAYTSNGKTKYEAQKSTSPVIYTTNPSDATSASSSHNMFVQDFSGSTVTNGLTDDGRWVRNVTINGSTYKMAMMPNGKTPSIFDILPCPTPAAGVMQQWEDTSWDGKKSDFPGTGGGSWSLQDFTFNVNTSAANSCASNPNYNNVNTTTANGAATFNQRSVFIKN